MNKIKDLILILSANIFLGTLSLIGKVYPVRIGRLIYDRGHLLVNTEYWLRTHPDPLKGLNFFVSSRKPWNRQALKMIKRKALEKNVLVMENDFMARLVTAFQRRKPESDAWINLKESGHFRFNEWNSVPPQLVFNKEEIEQGNGILKEMGITKNDPIVCFYSRDDRYLDAAIGHLGWGYHGYRNTNIENYLKAMDWLTADKGFWALRMGALVKHPLTTKNPRIIDYATKCRSDFMDAFLFSRCRFSVGDTAGTICFPNIFNTPVVFVNAIPLAFPARNKNGLTIYKKLMDKKKGRLVTFREIFENGMDMWLQAERYQEAGIEVIENSPQEIEDVTREMYLRLEGQWQQSIEDDRLQERFHAIIPKGHKFKTFLSRIGASFLRNNQELLG